MRSYPRIPWILAAVLSGCAETPPEFDPIGDGYQAEDTALELEQIEAEYDHCVSRLDSDHVACRQLQWMYDDARQHFNASPTRKTP